jgi:hypothetical protein
MDQMEGAHMVEDHRRLDRCSATLAKDIWRPKERRGQEL